MGQRCFILIGGLVALVAVASGTLGCGQAEPGPNIVVIVMDTTRQDRLSCYGYERETSPRLTELAESATVYTNAYSTSSWTGPGHASLFTGLHSVTHRVTQENWGMNKNLQTFAEVLGDRGYRTVGVVENPMLGVQLGYAQGFSEYLESWRTAELSSSGQAVVDFRTALDGGGTDRPFLMFVNLIAPHSPYNSSQQFRDRFVSNPEILVDSNMWAEYYTGYQTFTDDEFNHLSELYDAEVLYTDYLVGEMIDELVARDLWDDTVFIVTSDHGENIGDHEHIDHVFSLYESTTKVPLIIRGKGLFEEGVIEEAPVQLTDVFPTVLDIAGADLSDYPTHGLSLVGDELPADRATFTEYYYPVQVLSVYGRDRGPDPLLKPYLRRLRSITAGGMKFIWGSDERHELYHLAADPNELENLIDDPAHAAVAQDLEARLVAWVETHESAAGGVRDDTETDEERQEALRSLGYVK